MVVEFSLRCDGCHTVFRGDDQLREPVSVGCFHTLCAACAEGRRGAYGALYALAKSAHNADGDGGDYRGHDDDDDVDEAIRERVHGRCGVCGGGKGQVEVQEAVLLALEKAAEREADAVGEDHNGARPQEDKGAAEEEVLCEVCGVDGGERHTATHLCEDCNEHMCEAMATAHKRMRFSADHTIKQLESAKTLLCPAHRQPLLMCFCRDDRCLVCMECIVSNHSGHRFLRVGDALVDEMKGWLREEVEGAVVRACELEAMEAEFVEDRDAVIANARVALDGIEAVFGELEKRKQELIAEIVRVRKEACQRLNDVRTTSRALRLGVEAVQQALQTLHQSPTDSAVQRAGQVGHQLCQLVEFSGKARTQRGDITPVFLHSASELRAWRRTLAVSVADALDVEDLQVLRCAMDPPNSTHSASGVWFDVHTKDKAITIVSLLGGVHRNGPVTVFSCEGRGVDRANSADGWEVVSVGRLKMHEESELCMRKLVRVPPFSCRGFYVFCRGGRVNLGSPGEGFRGDVHAEDACVRLVYGGTHVQDTPFVGAREGPVQMLAGGLCYRLDPE